ncbi:MAG: hypothetical protein AVDCRST_MAG33-2560 [uncultured Thermomicrobiales bacterium]|uniref:Uncharacterized protein n=1 Tax=uncultured Thermomicrobiales bacterium TaxID=1645740 RepID=A0A6J4VC11_9BACT|nr:MAG: hypothetical protein AVDCRST_MAG33-2560 [uncultured Thermomicrobiales bacterium]
MSAPAMIHRGPPPAVLRAIPQAFRVVRDLRHRPWAGSISARQGRP